MKYLIGILSLLLAISAHASAGVVVNEALVNEPGSAVTLEWVELRNDSSGAVDLSYYLLSSGSSSVNLSGFINPNSYLVICRNLYSAGGTPGFEEIWGNNSGVWGDAPQENYRVVQGNLSLVNAAGSARLYRLSTIVSQLNWSSAGSDGVSWERISLQSDDAAPSQDPTGATPGRVNSVSPLPNDLSIDTVFVSPDSGRAQIAVKVVNVGLDTSLATSLLLHIYSPADSSGIGDTLQVLSIAPVAPGDSVPIETSLQVPGLYAMLGATLLPDDRVSNNQFIFRVPGSEFPPLLLMEFLADPAVPLTSEWVELLNISDSATDLRNWKFGDATSLRQIIPSAFVVSADQRIVLAQDTSAFRLHYSSFSGLLFQPTQWPALNNNGDLLRLVDPYGFEADRFVYSLTYKDNVTWARDESGDSPGAWGESADTGGTPGARNVLRKPPVSTGSEIIIEPQVFSPDGDGLDDIATLRIESPDAESYTLRIYDRTGRLVKTFAYQAESLSKIYHWDGRSDSGDRLPIGIYVCYFEADGVESLKKTVVIAR